MTVIDEIVAPRIVSSTPSSGGRETSFHGGAKRALDIAGSAVGLVLLLPALALVALLIRLDSAGPALYRQVRVGRGGAEFTMVKFRSMHLDADARLEALKTLHSADGPLFKLERDPRVTRVGRFLRRFSVDEIPQLWNVLRGDMSLVGPRPALPCEVVSYCDRARRRLDVLPGMTGPWQVGGRSTLGWNEGLDLDLHYVDHWSIGYDLRMLGQTVRAVVAPVGAY